MESELNRISVKDSHFENNGDVIVDGVKTTNIYLSLDYNLLLEEIKDTKEVLEAIPSDNLDLRIKQNQKLEQLTHKEKEFKSTVLQLAETFTKISIDTERLRIAKALFDGGKFKEADAALNAADMKRELDELLAREAFLDKEKEEIQKHRKQKANEYLIKAQTTYIDFDNPDRFEQTCNYYEEALRSFEDYMVLNTYAYFLDENNKHSKALELFEKILKIYKKNINKIEKVFLLNRIGVLYTQTNQINLALNKLTEALSICHSLFKTDKKYSILIAITQNSLGVFHKTNYHVAEALFSFNESLVIFRGLPKVEKENFLSYVADVLNNIGDLQRINNNVPEALKALNEALKIRRRLAKKDSFTYLPNVANTLNNLGITYYNNGELNKSLKCYTEGLSIQRSFAKIFPEIHLPYVALTLSNIGNIYVTKKKLNQALEFCFECVSIYRSLSKNQSNIYLSDLANALNNIGVVYARNTDFVMAIKSFNEALTIYKELSAINSEAYLPDIAMTLNNLGNSYKDLNETRKSLNAYKEALSIRRSLSQIYPEMFLPDLAMTLINLAGFYQDKFNMKQSLHFIDEALVIIIPLLEKLPYTHEHFEKASIVLMGWFINPQEYITTLIQRQLRD